MIRAVRAGDRADLDFLERMLLEAVNWRPGSTRTLDDVRRDPQLDHYVAGWGRHGDLGLVEEQDGRRLGAAWVRVLGSADPGCGFVDERTPELSVGVVPEWRGRGIGGRLVTALLREAAGQSWRAVSLSVEPDNPARRLYERLGFRKVGLNQGSWTMLRELL